MVQHLIFHNCPDTVKEGIRNYWSRKQPRIARLLQTFPEEQRHLRLMVDHNPDGYQARAVLMLPTQVLVAQSKTRQDVYQAAIDEAVDILAEEIRRHKDKLRRDRTHRKKQQQQTDVATALELLEQDIRQKRREFFFDLLRPVLRNLRNHARRELVFAQLEGNLAPNEMTVSDLLDEAILRAWERFEQRPPQQPLDQWIGGLMHEIIDEREAKAVPAISLETEILEDDPRFRVASGWILDNEPFWGDLESLTLEDILPQHEVEEPWESYSLDEKERWLFAQLSKLPKLQRRALMLYLLEGWEVEEIAMLQQRSVTEVRADIEAAQTFLKDQLWQQIYQPQN
ncbi:integrase [Fischerella thermalis CCMEE 5201]|nr:integrase [Fischerella thermalis CCMEE 5201]